MPKYLFNPKITTCRTEYDSDEEFSLECEIELTDEELTQLKELIKRKGTTNVEELELEKAYPIIYQKFEDVYREVGNTICSFCGYISAWLNRGDYDGDYDFRYAKEYCQGHFGYTVDEKKLEEECREDDGYDYEDDIEYEVKERLQEHFEEWFGHFLAKAPYSQELDYFLRDIVHIEDWGDFFYEFEIELPDQLLRDLDV